MDVTRPFLLLVALLLAWPSSGWPAADGASAASAVTPRVVVQLADDAPRPNPGHVFNPAAINDLLDKRSRGEPQAVNPNISWAASFRDQLQRCWKPPSAAFTIEVEINLKQDGTLAGEPRLVNPSDAVDHPETVASLRKAIGSCAPFHLPPEHYAIWKKFDIVFDGSKG